MVVIILSLQILFVYFLALQSLATHPLILFNCFILVSALFFFIVLSVSATTVSRWEVPKFACVCKSRSNAPH